MKLTLQQYDDKYIIETKAEDLALDDYVRYFRGLMLLAGFCYNDISLLLKTLDDHLLDIEDPLN